MFMMYLLVKRPRTHSAKADHFYDGSELTIYSTQNGLDLSLITRNVEMRLYQRGIKKPHSEGYHQQSEETNRDWEKILARG